MDQCFASGFYRHLLETLGNLGLEEVCSPLGSFSFLSHRFCPLFSIPYNLTTFQSCLHPTPSSLPLSHFYCLFSPSLISSGFPSQSQAPNPASSRVSFPASYVMCLSLPTCTSLSSLFNLCLSSFLPPICFLHPCLKSLS